MNITQSAALDSVAINGILATELLSAGDHVATKAFTGREWDPETGLYYYRARYYDPKAGRFVSEDPIGFEAGVNFHAYVGNNPALYRDPLGLEEFPKTGNLPGTNIPYRMDMNQSGGKNMHVYWEGTKNGPQTIVTQEGGWAQSHGSHNVVKPPQGYRDALRRVARSFVDRCSRTREVLGVAGNAISLALGMAEDLDTFSRAQDNNISFADQMRRDFADGPELLLTPIGFIPNPYRSPVIY